LRDRDSRIFPGQYVPVMVVEAGQQVVNLMRYQCHPAGNRCRLCARRHGRVASHAIAQGELTRGVRVRRSWQMLYIRKGHPLASDLRWAHSFVSQTVKIARFAKEDRESFGYLAAWPFYFLRRPRNHERDSSSGNLP
jgi:hypothetical protein